MRANLTIEEVQNGLRAKEFSAVELTQWYQRQIKEKNPHLNAYLTLNEEALATASLVDKKISAGAKIGPLSGIPMAIKDVIVTQGIRTTAGSKILENYIPPYDATVVDKIKKQAGIILGKVNCDEFAMGSSNENSAFGPTRNSIAPDRVPGGSSGGSAVAVAADLCTYSLGTDTGGSVRQPAAFCGVVGLKPTYGRCSRYGLIAMASSFDQPGVLAKTVKDAAIVLESIAGPDRLDSSAKDKPLKKWAAEIDQDVRGMRVALPKQFLEEGLNTEVEKSVRLAAEKLTRAGAKVELVDWPLLEMALAIYYIIMPAEVSANLARFDGIRYGMTVGAEDLWSHYQQTRGQLLGPEVKRRILTGTYVLSAGYYDAYYKKADLAKKRMRQLFAQQWQKYQAVLSPTTPTTAFKIGEKTTDPMAMYLSDVYTVVANIIGAPGISVPGGTDSQKLPIGWQLMSAPWREDQMLRLAAVLEKE
ncbi:MAG: Asp-tRNA(Asn)/Glu-tRNA(Gln) amidotransferase subunit GatA [Candidatus Komeilibacteria bacterium]|nr:Asp-tRNA(Asn)/Glu-tRNA(Gln) amidotransferase subunit GatA [Candidatus Komeilibacteria bacterium]